MKLAYGCPGCGRTVDFVNQHAIDDPLNGRGRWACLDNMPVPVQAPQTPPSGRSEVGDPS